METPRGLGPGVRLLPELRQGTGQRAGEGPSDAEHSPKHNGGIAVKTEDELLKRITARPDVFGGKPIIRDMRISVELILSLLAQGVSHEEILEDSTPAWSWRTFAPGKRLMHTPSSPGTHWLLCRLKAGEISRGPVRRTAGWPTGCAARVTTVIEARELGRDPGDRALLERAETEGRILITIDTDFGKLVHTCIVFHTRALSDFRMFRRSSASTSPPN